MILDQSKVDRACAEFYKGLQAVSMPSSTKRNTNLLMHFARYGSRQLRFYLRSLYFSIPIMHIILSLHPPLWRASQPASPPDTWLSSKRNLPPPYFLNPHHRDVAHTMILGERWAGKSYPSQLPHPRLRNIPLDLLFDLGRGSRALRALRALLRVESIRRMSNQSILRFHPERPRFPSVVR